MRSSICPDGKRRILTKIEVPMDIEDITRYAFESVVREHADRFDQTVRRDDYIVQLKKMNKRELLRAAKESIKSNGRNNTSLVIDPKSPTDSEVFAHVREMFPEVD